MLVFQSHWKHIQERFRERSGGDCRWLLKAVAKINLCLPDDRRMTRSTINFRIQITGKHEPALVDRSHRGPGDMILHIIDSVFRKEFRDNIDLRTKGSSARNAANTEGSSLLVADFYFFSPGPDNPISPLFTRQYEKVKRARDRKLLPLPLGHHRIHSLTNVRLDLDHFRWVLWKNDGTVELDRMPDPSFPGKNYWKTPALTGKNHRELSRDGLSVLASGFRARDDMVGLPLCGFRFFGG